MWGGGVQPGNRFVSLLRARGLVARWDSIPKGGGNVFFPLGPDLSLFPSAAERVSFFFM